jgi:hypothetical protein
MKQHQWAKKAGKVIWPLVICYIAIENCHS